MKDIDFDELDKAVNSLMATTTMQPSENPPVQSVEPVIAIPTSQAAPRVETPTAEQVVTAPVESPQAVPVSQPSLAQVPARPITAPAMRRSGRFMDMVNKPTEQKVSMPAAVAVTAAPTQTPPSREGLSITPRPEAGVPSVDPVPDTAPSAPDPIDTYEKEPTTSDTSDTAYEPFIDTSTQSYGPVESPFLSDTKVEKRPLNAGTNDSMVDLAAALEEDSGAQSELQVESGPNENRNDEPPVNPQVEELSSDLVAIEASENNEPPVAADTPDTPKPLDTQSTPLGPSSIPQQYATQPSSGDQSHAAIYDTAHYPEPIAHPAKTKSGWLWIVWVLLLLGVGAGGAVVLYTLGIIP